MANSEAEKFADKMGEAAKQLTQGLIKLMKIMEKMEKDKLNQLAKVDADLGKMLKQAGFEPSKGNIDLFKKHSENLKAAEAEVESVDASLEKAGIERNGLGEKKEGLEQKQRDNNLQRNDLRSKDSLSPDDAKVLQKLDIEAVEIGMDIEAVDQEIAANGKVIDGLQEQKLGADAKLEGLQNGEGLEGLKVDSLKQSLKVFKENSVGAKMMEKNALSTEAKIGAGVELPDASKLSEGLANAVKVAGVGGP